MHNKNSTTARATSLFAVEAMAIVSSTSKPHPAIVFEAEGFSCLVFYLSFFCFFFLSFLGDICLSQPNLSCPFRLWLMLNFVGVFVALCNFSCNFQLCGLFLFIYISVFISFFSFIYLYLFKPCLPQTTTTSSTLFSCHPHVITILLLSPPPVRIPSKVEGSDYA